MKKIITITLITTFAVLISGCSFSEWKENIANSYAEEIYYEFVDHWPDDPEFQAATNKLDLISYLDDDAEWVQLSYSMFILEQGYRLGDPFLQDSYVDTFLVASHKIASEAVKDSKTSEAFSHLARLQIIRGEYKKAWYTLNEAHQLDSTSFHPWYLKGIIFYFMNDLERAESMLVKSQKHAKFKFQKSFAINYRQDVARSAGNYRKEEQLLKQNIRENPNNAYLHADYGHFLKRQKRYLEAIEFFEKAVELKPYRNAVKILNELKKKYSNGTSS